MHRISDVETSLQSGASPVLSMNINRRSISNSQKPKHASAVRENFDSNKFEENWSATPRLSWIARKIHIFGARVFLSIHSNSISSQLLVSRRVGTRICQSKRTISVVSHGSAADSESRSEVVHSQPQLGFRLLQLLQCERRTLAVSSNRHRRCYVYDRCECRRIMQ